MSKQKIEFITGTEPNEQRAEPIITEVVNQNTAEGAPKYIKFWRGNATQYSMLTELDKNTVYIVEQEI